MPGEPIKVLSKQQCDVGPRVRAVPRRVILAALLALVFLLAACAGSTLKPGAGVAPTTSLSSPLWNPWAAAVRESLGVESRA